MKETIKLAISCVIFLCCLTTGYGNNLNGFNFPSDPNSEDFKSGGVSIQSQFPPADVGLVQSLSDAESTKMSSINTLTNVQQQQNLPTNQLSFSGSQNPGLPEQNFQLAASSSSSSSSSSQQNTQQASSSSQQMQQIPLSAQQAGQPIPLMTAEQMHYQQQQQQQQVPITAQQQYQQGWQQQQLPPTSQQMHQQQLQDPQYYANGGGYNGQPSQNQVYQDDNFMYGGNRDVVYTDAYGRFQDPSYFTPNDMGYGNQNYHGYGNLPYNHGFVQYRYPVEVPYHHAYGHTGSRSALSDVFTLFLLTKLLH